MSCLKYKIIKKLRIMRQKGKKSNFLWFFEIIYFFLILYQNILSCNLIDLRFHLSYLELVSNIVMN